MSNIRPSSPLLPFFAHSAPLPPGYTSGDERHWQQSLRTQRTPHTARHKTRQLRSSSLFSRLFSRLSRGCLEVPIRSQPPLLANNAGQRTAPAQPRRLLPRLTPAQGSRHKRTRPTFAKPRSRHWKRTRRLVNLPPPPRLPITQLIPAAGLITPFKRRRISSQFNSPFFLPPPFQPIAWLPVCLHKAPFTVARLGFL